MIFEKQIYQQECVNNICKLLKNFDFKAQNTKNLSECFDEFYKQNPQIPHKFKSGNLNIDILMETGTGKTFTYLNLIFELHKNFRQNKFIIFVPRKAILESVRQNIELTKQYFFAQYKQYLKPYFYSENVKSAIISHYINSPDELSVLVLTNSAIDKDSNILHKQDEGLFNSGSIFQNIIDLKPLVIIDEPHLLKGDKFSAKFKEIKTLYFRFGATFPNEDSFKLSNLAFCLDSKAAFKKYLVKQVNVNSIFGLDGKPKLLNTNPKAKTAQISYFKSGVELTKTLNLGDDLGGILPDVSIVKIQKDKLYLSNGEILGLNTSYTLNEQEISALLKLAIKCHFEKESELFAKNIKALSLFFIPNIADFRGENPFIKNEFERLYKIKRDEILKGDLKPDYREFLSKDIDENGTLRVAQGYFSGDSGSKGNKDEKEAADIAMILNDKEKLLSLKTPLRFIFSVWALQEGWDNPNIFTLTKLASSTSDTSRHQQIGRGLRLAVNDEGKRITHNFVSGDENVFYNINSIDVIVSSNERQFLEGLQSEINAISYTLEIISSEKLKDLGLNDREANKLINYLEDLKVIDFDEASDSYKIIGDMTAALNEPKIREFLSDDKITTLKVTLNVSDNKRNQIERKSAKKQMIKIRANLAKEFRELWQNINKSAQIVYKDINTNKLIDNITTKFNSIKINHEVIYVESKKLDPATNKIINLDSQIIAQKSYKNLAKDIKTLLLEFSKNQKIPLNFLLKLYARLDKSHFEASPKRAFNALAQIYKDELHKHLIASVDYKFSDYMFSNDDLLYTKDGMPKECIAKEAFGAKNFEPSGHNDKFLFDGMVYDSAIEKEVISEGVISDVSVFAKLPNFSIQTPFSSYKPDFAYLINTQNSKKIFFICETKGIDYEGSLRNKESEKIKYAEVFFKKLDSHLQGQNISVRFEKRLNKNKLVEILHGITKGQK